MDIQGAIIGLVAGAAGVWWILRSVFSAKLDAIKKEKEGLSVEISSLRKEHLSEMERRSVAEEQVKRLLKLEEDLRQAHQKVIELTSENSKNSAEIKGMEEKVLLLDKAKETLSDTFKALSSEALKSSNQSFIELAKATLEKYQETAKGDLEKRQQAITELVKPIGESLSKVDSKIQALEKERVGAYAGLTEQVKSLLDSSNYLRSETSNLVKALHSSTGRGRWGEIQLKRVVEMAGMIAHCDFYEQASVDASDGRFYPDMMIKLPAGKNIIVDAKTPLSAYLEAIETVDDNIRKAKLQDHARQVKERIRELGKKSYWEKFHPTPEFVVLFMPGEIFFSAALEYDPSLIEAGVEQGVIIATPTTLIALLRAVAYGWRQESLAQNAKEIGALGKELYKRLTTMGDHIAKLGNSLKKSVESYNAAIGSLETQVLSSARKFKELKAIPDGMEIEQLEPIDHSVREFQKTELITPLICEQNKEENINK